MVRKNVTRTPVYVTMGAMGGFALACAGAALGYGLSDGIADVSLASGSETTTVIVTESEKPKETATPSETGETGSNSSEPGSSESTAQSTPGEPTESTPDNPTGRGLSAPDAAPGSGGAAQTAPTPGAKGQVVNDYYVVAPGDTLSAISGRFGISVNHLVAWNGIANPNLIYANSALELRPR